MEGLTPSETKYVLKKMLAENSLSAFVRQGWSNIDPSPYKESWAIDAVCKHLEAVSNGEIKNLLINIPPRMGKSSLTSVAWPAWVWAQRNVKPLKGPQVQFMSSSYASTLSERDSTKMRRLITSSWYQSNWGERFKLVGDQNTKRKFENSKGGYRLATSVTGTQTGDGGTILLVDDPISANDAHSEIERQNVIRWWTETMPTRLNDPMNGARVVIMQRLHEEDLSGYILEHNDNGEWEHLMLPMRYEPRTHCFTSIGWEDPRLVEGELLCPNRFDEDSVLTLERTLGSFTCTPYESPILMADLTMKPIGEIKVGDDIVGFAPLGPEKFRKRSLVPAKVKNVFTCVKPVVRMTLDTGKIIRCTADHKWYRKKREAHRPEYLPAVVGTKLARVCPSSLPELTKEEERLAGWLSGFFDGEGTVSLCKKGRGYRPSAAILFYQGAGRNLPLCEKLEAALEYFGFPYFCSEFVRTDRINKTEVNNYMNRSYRLNSNGLPLHQKFLHIVQPSKWKQRIIDGAFTTKFVNGYETVVSIEPDGEETVYALETTTGNYVVWGFASSNSAGQLQQTPVVKGGGIIKDDWWKIYPPLEWQMQQIEYPMYEYILMSCDTAYTDKQENDYSACTVWGVWRYREESKIMLIDAWQERLPFHELVEKIIKTARLRKIDKLIVEAKASGLSIVQEIKRLCKDEDFSIEAIQPRGDGARNDKVSRVYPLQPLFENGTIYAPDTKYADMVIQQFSAFPKGKHDDLVDSSSLALNWLRRIGIAQLSIESRQELMEERSYRPSTVQINELYGI